MRISDWSSDVCSTDAIAREAREGNPYANVIAVRTENKDDPAIRKFVAAYESPEVAEFLETRFKGAILPRSEEHTSELQSLMRISYAVFCLKKKITTHTIT